jgi:hypothetical protein
LYDKIAALSGFLKYLGLKLLQLVRGEWILSRLVATLTDFLRKSQLVGVGRLRTSTANTKLKGEF